MTCDLPLPPEPVTNVFLLWTTMQSQARRWSGSSGGALAAKDCRFELSSCAFRDNEGGTGSALYYGGTTASPLSTIEDTRFFNNTPDPTVQADALINWICFPGQYMLQAGPAKGDGERRVRPKRVTSGMASCSIATTKSTVFVAASGMCVSRLLG